MPTNYTQLTTNNEVESAREEMAVEEKPEGSEAKGLQVDEMFDMFWSLYPIRKAKLAAKKSFSILIRRGLVDFDELIQATARYRKHYERLSADDKKFTKHPATWLNQGCWDDEIAEAKPNTFHIGF